MPAKTVSRLGKFFINLVNEMGGLFLFFLDAFRQIWTSVRQVKRILTQVYIIGTQSIPVIMVVGLFTGMVLGLQGYYALVKVGSEGFLGGIVALALIRELGPVLTAIMITARAGSAMTAEIGVMRITDQIVALEVMDISPVRFLVAPRLAAAIIAFPLLTAIFDVIGIFGGFLTGVSLLGINEGVYFFRISAYGEISDLIGGTAKAIVFGILVITVCCYRGYYVHQRTDSVGPESVGAATTSAVVLSCILILVSDYVLTSILL